MRTARIFSVIVRRASNVLVAPLELLSMPATPGSIQGPVFIVGVPRSGTTLLYQLITAAFDVAYISNRHCRWFRAPTLVERIRSTPFGAQPAFASTFGITQGPHAPSECAPYWYRFLPRRPHTLTTADVTPIRIERLRRSVGALSIATDRMLVFKNLVLSLRIPVLQQAFPNAMFLNVNRDPVDTGLSILRARKKLFGDIGHWFSIRPTGCNDFIDPIEQVFEQVRRTKEEIKRASLDGLAESFLDIDYDSLCSDPVGIIENVEAFALKRNLNLRRRSNFNCPSAFREPRQASDRDCDLRKTLNALASQRPLP